jgi:hypothetical protein
VNFKEYNALALELCSGRGVYHNLKTLGITGIPKSTCDCPIANYFKMHRAYDVVVARSWVFEGEEFRVTLPFAIRQFVILFDKGRYPDLEK